MKISKHSSNSRLGFTNLQRSVYVPLERGGCRGKPWLRYFQGLCNRLILRDGRLVEAFRMPQNFIGPTRAPQPLIHQQRRNKTRSCSWFREFDLFSKHQWFLISIHNVHKITKKFYCSLDFLNERSFFRFTFNGLLSVLLFIIYMWKDFCKTKFE